MKIVLVGPNINQAGSTNFHVHAAGCRDVAQPKYRAAEKDVMEIASIDALARDVYADQIRESGDPDISAYIADFTVLPCAAAFK